MGDLLALRGLLLAAPLVRHPQMMMMSRYPCLQLFQFVRAKRIAAREDDQCSRCTEAVVGDRAMSKWSVQKRVKVEVQKGFLNLKVMLK